VESPGLPALRNSDLGVIELIQHPVWGVEVA